MERYDVNEGARLAEMVSAAERGEDVEITREGAVVAKVQAAPSRSAAASFDAAEWTRLHELTAPLRNQTGTDLVRRMRDEDDA